MYIIIETTVGRRHQGVPINHGAPMSPQEYDEFVGKFSQFLQTNHNAIITLDTERGKVLVPQAALASMEFVLGPADLIETVEVSYRDRSWEDVQSDIPADSNNA